MNDYVSRLEKILKTKNLAGQYPEKVQSLKNCFTPDRQKTKEEN
tara:strand:+ start:62 stop:193 length:132 start_codon:yes stop_codon:yes gene_type:complete